jgi:hypothetical protein
MRTSWWRQRLPWLTLVLVVLCAVACLQLWIKLSTIQEQLARQSADATQLSVQANSLAKRAEEITQETAAKVTLLDLRLNEVALQRTQLEELIQSLSRSRDENLVVDIESALGLAQQQAELTGSFANRTETFGESASTQAGSGDACHSARHRTLAIGIHHRHSRLADSLG